MKCRCRFPSFSAVPNLHQPYDSESLNEDTPGLKDTFSISRREYYDCKQLIVVVQRVRSLM